MTSLAETGNMPEILRIQEILRALPQLDAPVQHYHIDGVYVRSLFMPAGTMATGKIHKFEGIGILAQGRLRIANAQDTKIIEAPYVMVDKPGIKRLVYAETDVTFITIHKVTSTSIEDIEKELVTNTFEEYEQFLQLTNGGE